MMLEKNGFPARNDSWDSRHPTLNAGKVPHWWLGPNLEEPSRRTVRLR